MKLFQHLIGRITHVNASLSQQEKWGVFFMVLGMFIFTSVNALLKTLHHAYPIIEVVCLRNAYALLTLAIFLKMQKQSFAFLHTSIHARRGVFGSFGHILLFSSLFLLPLSLANVLSFTTTFVICALSSFWMEENLSFQGWIAIIVGFLGVAFVSNPFQPNHLSFLPVVSGMICAITACFFEGSIMVHNRVFATKESPERMVFFYAFFASCFMGSMLLLVTLLSDFKKAFLLFSSLPHSITSQTWTAPTLHDHLIFLCFGIGGGLGQMCITRAYACTRAYVLAPLIYTAMLWGTFYGVLFFNEILTLHFWIGSFFIIGSGLFILLKRP